MTRRPFESPYIFGIHEPGGEQYMLEAGRPGWVLFTEGIGRDPYNRSGRDYRAWATRELGVMVRLNHGYYPLGTIPPSDEHPDFARRCANFVAASQGCHIWIIGNEMNYAAERPGIGIRSGPRLLADDPAHADPFLRGLPSRFGALNPVLAMADARTRSAEGEVITPEVYARCYRLCRDAIHQVPGHQEDLVLVGAVAPWNVDTRYSGNPSGDWIRYFRDILLLLGPEGCDGITLHAYTHGPDPQLIQDETRLSTFAQYHQQFRVYQDFLHAVPANMRHLPAYITETNQGDPWLDANNGWVQAAYAEIHAWNSRPDTQKIRALVLYRWPRVDKWYIEGKRGVVADFRAALQHDYRWDRDPPSPTQAPRYGVEWIQAELPAPLHAGDTIRASVTVRNAGALPWPAQGDNPVRLTYRFYRNRVEVASPQVRPLLSDLPHDVPPGGTVTIRARIALPPEPGSYTLEMDLVHQGITRFSEAGAPVLRHWVTLRPTPVAVPSSPTPGQEVTPVEPPPIIDIRRKLPRGDQPYQRRSLRQVRYLILNHTAAPPTMPVQEIAQAHVQAGYPGIAYDYFVQADGTIYQVSDLEEVIQADAIWSGGGINICLEGNFNEEPPSSAQLEATARLCAWLVDHLGLGPEAIVGLRELIQTTSPGDTFLEGPGWKQALVERVRQLLGQGTPAREAALTSAAPGASAPAEPTAEPVFPAAGEAVRRPPIQDVIHRLPRDPIRMARRRAEDIRYVVINHTAGPADLSLEVIARAFRERLPGILYQFYITADGTIYQTQPLLEAVEGEKPYIFNAINIGFAGDFTDTVPTPAQILAGGWLIAWLLQQFPGLTMDAVKGVQEFISHSSPGRQWLEGRRWKDLLLNAVRQVQSGILAEEAVSDLAQSPAPPPRRSVSPSLPAAGELEQLRQENRVLQERNQTLQQENQDLRQELGRLQAELSRIQEAHEQLVQEMEKQRESSPATAPLGPPPIHDVVEQLPRHPTLRYEQRSRREITHLVIHHTGAPLHVGPEQIAELHIEEDPDQGKVAWPGIGYHFFIRADGRIDQTNRLETVSYHVAGHNRASVGIAFAGSFMAGSVPTERQIQAGAHLIAWLMHELGIPPSNVVGHQEFPDNETTCPGLEWRQGRRWREELFRELTRLLSGQGGRPIYHYLLFSPRSDPRSKVSTYLRHAVAYIERFRPTVGFRVEEAMLAHYVTIVGDESRVSVQDEQRLREAGVAVERLPGANEVDTARVLSELVERRRRFWALDEEG